jgi:hypothetical protein
MKKIHLTFLFISFHLFSQSSTLIKFDELNLKIQQSNINFDSLGTDKQRQLNKIEITLLELLNNNKEILTNKKVTFITGSAGKSISSKNVFFDSFKDRYYKNDILSFLMVKLDEKSRDLSNSDYLLFFWVKTCNPKSKKLLKKIKQTNPT